MDVREIVEYLRRGLLIRYKLAMYINKDFLNIIAKSVVFFLKRFRFDYNSKSRENKTVKYDRRNEFNQLTFKIILQYYCLMTPQSFINFKPNIIKNLRNKKHISLSLCIRSISEILLNKVFGGRV